jgi:hypothetical protein
MRRQDQFMVSIKINRREEQGVPLVIRNEIKERLRAAVNGLGGVNKITVEQMFPDFDNLAESRKRALIDMRFNLDPQHYTRR